MPVSNSPPTQGRTRSQNGALPNPKERFDDLEYPTTKKQPFQLNKARTIQKVLSGTSIDSVVTSTGGGTKFELNTAGYSILRKEIYDLLLNDHTGIYSCEIDKSCDENNQEYMAVIKVKKAYNDQSIHYTINLWHTKSKILVNGAGEGHFCSHDLLLLYNRIDAKQACGEIPSEEMLNNAIIECLAPIAQTQINKSDTKVSNTKHRRGKSKSPNKNIPSSGAPSLCVILCPKCNKNCVTRYIICKSGNHRIHYRCAKLTTHLEIARAEEQNSFSCSFHLQTPKCPTQAISNTDISVIKTISHNSNSNTAPPIPATLPQASQHSSTQPIVTDVDDAIVSTTSGDPSPAEGPIIDDVTEENSSTSSQHVQSSGLKIVPNSNNELVIQSSSSVQNKHSVTNAATASNSKSLNSSDLDNQWKELRQKQKDLRKWEEELKLREQQVSDYETQLAHARSIAIQYEAEIRELKESVRILKIHKNSVSSESINQAPTRDSPHDELPPNMNPTTINSTQSGLSSDDLSTVTIQNQRISMLESQITNIRLQTLENQLRANSMPLHQEQSYVDSQINKINSKLETFIETTTHVLSSLTHSDTKQNSPSNINIPRDSVPSPSTSSVTTNEASVSNSTQGSSSDHIDRHGPKYQIPQRRSQEPQGRVPSLSPMTNTGYFLGPPIIQMPPNPIAQRLQTPPCLPLQYNRFM